MQKNMKKLLTTTLATAVVIGSTSIPAFAGTSGDFEVSLSSVKVGSNSSVEFEIPTGDAYLSSGKNIKITFPYQWEVPSSIDEEDILLNGEEPTDVKVSGKTITITTPDSVEGEEEINVEVTQEAGLINPKKEGDYTIRVSAELEEKHEQSGTVKEKAVHETYQSDSFKIEDPNKTSTNPTSPNKPTNPHPIPSVSEQVKGTSEVIVRIGSTMGFYQKPTKMGKGVITKVGKLAAAPYLSQGYTMIPFRFVAEGLDATLGYDEKTGIVGVYINGQYMEFKAGSKIAVIDGVKVEMPIAPEIKENQMMLPLRFVVEKMGAKVTWFGETQTILITK